VAYRTGLCIAKLSNLPSPKVQSPNFKLKDLPLVQARLIIFARYPEAGKAKTRLIPALGAEGAAALYQQMAEYLLVQVQKLQFAYPLCVEVRFAGGNRDLMQRWLGKDLMYTVQGEGDLGDRLARSFQAAFGAGVDQVVTIGTDCPDLDADLMQQAFQALANHDLVLGPALDGGYYLIGLQRSIPELFQGIAWSTSEVLQQTVAIAQSLNLSIAYLPPLSDVDRPEDLAIWHSKLHQATLEPTGSEGSSNAQGSTSSSFLQSLDSSSSNACSLSLIIPVLNEAANLPMLLTSLQVAPDVEVIVVDGGSQDETVAIARSLGAKVLVSSPGRAMQMNAGAAIATGEILLFLHADTRLPQNFVASARETLAQPGVVAGAFELQIDGVGAGLRWVEWGVRWRSRWLQMPYGDQAIFLKAGMFRELGGFPELPIMEDFELIRQLQRRGQIAIVPEPVLTSGRRWQKLGVVRTTLLNQAIVVAYLLGMAPHRLVRWYRGKKT
jgi:rSAM/selenodomain-associated transferase 2/rSAM/selenodomain-associated transferase 1